MATGDRGVSSIGSIAFGANDAFCFGDLFVDFGIAGRAGVVLDRKVHANDVAGVYVLMDNLHFIALGSTVVLAMLAGTLRSLKGNLIYRPIHQARFVASRCVGVLEGFLWFLCIASLLGLAPHPVAVVIVFMIVASVISSFAIRYREERRSLNRWLRFAGDQRVALPEFLDRFADGCRSGIARRAKYCAWRMVIGEDLGKAIRRSKLPVDADAVAAYLFPDSEHPPMTATDRSPVSTQQEIQRDYEAAQSSIRSNQQLIYIVVTFVVMVFVAAFVRNFIVPTLDQMQEEFFDGASHSPSYFLNDWLQLSETLGYLCLVLMGILGVLVLLSPWLPRAALRCIPWFGVRVIDRRRGEFLESLGRGLAAGQAESELLKTSANIAKSHWIRVASSRAILMLVDGVTAVTALCRTGLVTEKEKVWLANAEKNSNLPSALIQLKDDLQRRQTYRWNLRMAWFLPLATMLIGAFIFLHAFYMFHVLCTLIGRMAV